MDIGTQVTFILEGQTYTGTIAKSYTNSYLITFTSPDPAIVDKYHNKFKPLNSDLKQPPLKFRRFQGWLF